jgi:hypothetical protein
MSNECQSSKFEIKVKAEVEVFALRAGLGLV